MTQSSADKEGEGLFLTHPQKLFVLFLTLNISAKTIRYFTILL
jgi:hypothetical protein